MDLLAEKYFSESSYVYAVNNPMFFIDPDGNSIIIWYEDEKGNTKSFVFNGKNASSAPNNTYVQNFLSAYTYNLNNGGGDNLKELALSDEYHSNVVYSEFKSSSRSASRTIFWNDTLGMETDTGNVLSPATILEHEADHSLTSQKEGIQKFDERRKTEDKDYGNKEERRVIMGSEQKTARANNEIKNGTITRKNHKGESVVTEGPTSNKINKQKTYEFYVKMNKKTPYDVDKQLKKYKP